MSALGSYSTAILVAYLIGSVPFGYLTGRWVAGVDIRTRGSGNIGATNVGRMIGTKWGLLVLLLDGLKGFLPTWGLPIVLGEPLGASRLHLAVACGMAAIIGHMFPCWLRLRGGKGVATTLGVILTLSPWGTLAAFGMFAAVFLTCRIVSLGSILAAVTFAATQLSLLAPHPFSADTWSLAVFSLLVPALITIRHRTNIRRLLRGEEPPLRTLRTRSTAAVRETRPPPAGTEQADSDSSRLYD